MYRVIAADLFTFMDILLHYGLTHRVVTIATGTPSSSVVTYYLASYPGHNERPGYEATYYTMAILTIRTS